jgi:hypothetical protein
MTVLSLLEASTYTKLLCSVRNGNYQWVWFTDIGLASVASLVNFPIREPKVTLAVPGF